MLRACAARAAKRNVRQAVTKKPSAPFARLALRASKSPLPNTVRRVSTYRLPYDAAEATVVSSRQKCACSAVQFAAAQHPFFLRIRRQTAQSVTPLPESSSLTFSSVEGVVQGQRLMSLHTQTATRASLVTYKKNNCPQCGEWLLAPDWSEYLDTRCVRTYLVL